MCEPRPARVACVARGAAAASLVGGQQHILGHPLGGCPNKGAATSPRPVQKGKSVFSHPTRQAARRRRDGRASNAPACGGGSAAQLPHGPALALALAIVIAALWRWAYSGTAGGGETGGSRQSRFGGQRWTRGCRASGGQQTFLVILILKTKGYCFNIIQPEAAQAAKAGGGAAGDDAPAAETSVAAETQRQMYRRRGRRLMCSTR